MLGENNQLQQIIHFLTGSAEADNRKQNKILRLVILSHKAGAEAPVCIATV
jgi:hypothetical protein